MLTDATGVTYQLQGDDSLFASNVSKEVEVVGTAGASATASASTPDTSSAGTSGSPSSGTPDTGASAGSTVNANAAKTLAVTSVRKVADSCTASQTPQQ